MIADPRMDSFGFFRQGLTGMRGQQATAFIFISFPKQNSPLTRDDSAEQHRDFPSKGIVHRSNLMYCSSELTDTKYNSLEITNKDGCGDPTVSAACVLHIHGTEFSRCSRLLG
jgi:hypothetical protein